MAASKPTSLLSEADNTLQPIALNRYLGALTAVWVVPLSEVKFTPGFLSSGVYDVTKFGVGQRTESFRTLNPKSVSLPLLLSRPEFD